MAATGAAEAPLTGAKRKSPRLNQTALRESIDSKRIRFRRRYLIALKLNSLNDPIGSRCYGKRNYEAHGSRCLQIDDQLDASWVIKRKRRGRNSLQEPVRIFGGPKPVLVRIRAIGDDCAI